MTVIALAGDLLVTRPLSTYVSELSGVTAYVRAADCGFGNLETLFHDFQFPPMPTSGGAWLRSPPGVAAELRTLGFSLVSLANNHAMDYGWGALSATMSALDDAGIAHSGAGADISMARAPAFLRTSGGRVALVSVTTAYTPFQLASDGAHGIPGRPGTYWIGSETACAVAAEDYAALRRVYEAMNGRPAPTRYVRIGGATFYPRTEHSPAITLSAPHIAGLQETVEAAAAQADHVLVSIHSHDAGSTMFLPSDNVIHLARAAADAGAGLVACHGPHVIRGAEIYRQSVLLYGLGSFFFQNRGLPEYPLDARTALGLDPEATPEQVEALWFDYDSEEPFWDTVGVVSRWRDNRVAELTVHPIVLSRGPGPERRGLPGIAAPSHGRRITEMFAELCRALGTRAHVTGATAVIRP